MLFLSTSGLFIQIIEKQDEDLLHSIKKDDKVNENTEKEKEKAEDNEKSIEDKQQKAKATKQRTRQKSSKAKKDSDECSHRTTSQPKNSRSKNESITETDLQQQQQQPLSTKVTSKNKNYVIFRTFGNAIKISGIELKETTLSLFIGNKNRIYHTSFDLSKEHTIENEEMQITSNYEFKSKTIFSLKNSEITSMSTSDYNLFLYFTLYDFV